MVWAMLVLMRAGDYGAPVNRWRGGGNPVDLAWLLLPQYWQPLWRDALARWAGPAHYSFFGLGPLAALVWLWRRRPAAPALLGPLHGPDPSVLVDALVTATDHRRAQCRHDRPPDSR